MARLIVKIKVKRLLLILALRVLLAFAVSALDYRLAVVPVSEDLRAPLQVQVGQAARAPV